MVLVCEEFPVFNKKFNLFEEMKRCKATSDAEPSHATLICVFITSSMEYLRSRAKASPGRLQAGCGDVSTTPKTTVRFKSKLMSVQETRETFLFSSLYFCGFYLNMSGLKFSFSPHFQL